MMDVCGEAENKLATELSQHEVQIERDILEPLNQMAEVKCRHCPDTSYCLLDIWINSTFCLYAVNFSYVDVYVILCV